MKTLVIDASTKVSYISLYEGNKKLDESLRLSSNDHSKYLINIVKTMIEKNGLKPNDINSIIVGIGPGSYTGIRVAVSIAKIFAYTKEIQIKTVSSLILLSSGYNELVLPKIDARRGQVFAVSYEKDRVLLEESLYLKEDLCNNENLIYALSFELAEDTIKVDINNILNYIKLEEDVHLVEPNYLRKTEAERNYDKKS